jgi:hypothetical protein
MFKSLQYCKSFQGAKMDDLFEKLRKVQLAERRHATLTEINSDAYAEIRARLCELEAGLSDRQPEEQREYASLSHIAKDIVFRRKQKIVAKAQRDLSNNQISSEGLAAEERDFYLSLIGLLKNLDSVFSGNAPAKPVAAKPQTQAETAFAAVADAITLRVKMLSDIPEFLSSSFETLGPFSKSQVLELPKEDADLLVGRNLAAVAE